MHIQVQTPEHSPPRLCHMIHLVNGIAQTPNQWFPWSTCLLVIPNHCHGTSVNPSCSQCSDGIGQPSRWEGFPRCPADCHRELHTSVPNPGDRVATCDRRSSTSAPWAENMHLESNGLILQHLFIDAHAVEIFHLHHSGFLHERRVEACA